ncbi:MAG: MG2 domain-containing protein [Proteobacteria bacterium]|nr:MG2 domain-containing protein [Pseudomonadota bacterium]
MKFMPKHLLLIAIATTLIQCGGTPDAPRAIPKADDTTLQSSSVNFIAHPEVRGLQISLHAAPDTPDAAPRATLASGAALTHSERTALLSRVAPLPTPAPIPQSHIRDTTPLPDKAQQPSAPPLGQAPDTAPPTATAGPLTVLRHAPEGEVALAPHMSLTFSKPMVPVGQPDPSPQDIPITISPSICGTWQWLGTQTLVFRPEGRFAMATRYTVEIPKGTRSADGDTLQKALCFSFATPPLSIVRRWPEGAPHDIHTPVFIEFNQQINPKEVLPFVRLQEGDNAKAKPIAMTLVNPEDYRHKPEITALISQAKPGRFLLLAPEAPLRPATAISVQVQPGAPSAEGDRKTTQAQTFQFHTRAPLKVAETRCGWDPKACPVGAAWQITFNNPIDSDKFDPARISVSPAVPGLIITQNDRWITLRGDTKAHTRYTVSLPADLDDVFAQSLGDTAPLVFTTEDAEPRLVGPADEWAVLAPEDAGRIPLHSVGIRQLNIEVRAVDANDFNAFTRWRSRRYDKTPPLASELPGRRLTRRAVSIDVPAGERARTLIDLRPHLQQGTGQFIVHAAPAKQPNEKKPLPGIAFWVQVTRLGLSAFSDGEHVLAWATALADGAPLSGVTLSLRNGDTSLGQGTSDAAGLARLPLSSPATHSALLVAQRDGDIAFLPHVSVRTADVDHRYGLWHIFDDRGTYKPGETLNAKGWLREDAGWKSDAPHLPDHIDTVDWRLVDPRGNEIKTGTASLSRAGGFHLSVALPADMALGNATLHFTAKRRDDTAMHATHYLNVQEFRRPEFEVTTQISEGPHRLGEQAHVTAQATYYEGGALHAADVQWQVTARQGDYRPPGHPDHHFGEYNPFWRMWRPSDFPETREQFSGQTDGTGAHQLRLHFAALHPPRPVAVTAEAAITDINRQQWASSQHILVHPSQFYVGLRTAKTFIEKGKELVIDSVVTDIDGAVQHSAPIEMTLERLTGRWRNHRYEETPVDSATCRIDAGATAKTCTFAPEHSGTYRLTATVRDTHGRPNQSELRIWVSGGAGEPATTLERDRVQIIPERDENDVGDTARFLVQAPFFPAHATATVQKGGILETISFQMNAATHTLEIPIRAVHMPGFALQIDMVGTAPLDDAEDNGTADARRPAHATGRIDVKVPLHTRALHVAIAPDASVLPPQGATALHLTVTDAQGKPVRDAELAVVVADEAILALSRYELRDPLQQFYVARSNRVWDQHQRDHLLQPSPQNDPTPDAAWGGSMDLAAPTAMPMLMKSGATRRSAKEDAAATSPIALRSDLTPLALFAPLEKTDARGQTNVALQLPDNLTRYRIMVTAVKDADKAGIGEANITARLPLAIKPQAPRFLRLGDAFDLPVVLHNQTEDDQTVSLALRAQHLAFADPSGKKGAAPLPETGQKGILVPAGDRVEVRFSALPQQPGTAHVQFVATSETGADAAQIQLPIYTPATSESHATYGVLDTGAVAQSTVVPSDVWPDYGGLDIRVASTQLSVLADAVWHLGRHPLDHTEALASRIWALSLLKDVLSAFDAPQMPDPETLAQRIQADIDNLVRRQHANGGFGFWDAQSADWPYLSVYVAQALTAAEQKGFAVPPRTRDALLGYIARIDTHIPASYSPASRAAIKAFALNVLWQNGDLRATEAAQLLRSEDYGDHSMETLGWLLPVLHAGNRSDCVSRVLRHGEYAVAETAAGAHFITAYEDGAHVLLHSERRVDAIWLAALIALQPESDLVPKLAHELTAYQQRVRHPNTQEEAFVIMALHAYFQRFEADPPQFTARAWRDRDIVISHAFAGRSTDPATAHIPMAELLKGKRNHTAPITVGHQGKGRLYYRIGLTASPQQSELGALDHGFVLTRTYEAIDDPGDVRRDEQGAWHIRLGARVTVRIAMVAPMRRHHVALYAPLPAGLEALNPALAVQGALPDEPDTDALHTWWYRPWFAHQNLRDDLAEAFTDWLPAGVYDYSFTARATTPGTFVVPPVRAEELYHPETFGRSPSERIVVK